MPDFGYKVVTAATVNLNDKISGVLAACPGGVGVSITVYLRQWSAGEKVKCCLYDAAGDKVTNGETEERTTGGATGWYTFNFPVGPTLPAADYWIVVFADSTVAADYKYIGAGAYKLKYEGARVYELGFPASISGLGIDYEDSALVIYCTYTAVTPPTPPTSLEVDGQSSPIGVNCISNSNPNFTAIFNDPGDQSNAIQIQVGSASGLSDMWDSGWIADSTADGNRCSNKAYAGAALSAGTSYWWRCRFRDDGNADGAWSAWQRFDRCAAVAAVAAGGLLSQIW